MEAIPILSARSQRCTQCGGLWLTMGENRLLKAEAERVDTGDASVGKRYNLIDRIDCRSRHILVVSACRERKGNAWHAQERHRQRRHGVSLAEQLVRAAEVQRPGEVGVHPGAGGTPGVGLGADVDLPQRPVEAVGRDDVLDGGPVTFGEACPQGLGLGDDLCQRGSQPPGIDRSADFQKLSRVEDRAAGIQLLGIPDTGLGAGEWQMYVPAVRHSNSPSFNLGAGRGSRDCGEALSNSGHSRRQPRLQ
jgi:hypothetical protein